MLFRQRGERCPLIFWFVQVKKFLLYSSRAFPCLQFESTMCPLWKWFKSIGKYQKENCCLIEKNNYWRFTSFLFTLLTRYIAIQSSSHLYITFQVNIEIHSKHYFLMDIFILIMDHKLCKYFPIVRYLVGIQTLLLHIMLSCKFLSMNLCLHFRLFSLGLYQEL